MSKDPYKKADYRNPHELRSAEAKAARPDSYEHQQAKKQFHEKRDYDQAKAGRRDFWDRPVAEKPAGQGVTITGVDVPMGQLTVLMIKLAIAAVPAAIIASILWSIIGAFLGGAFLSGL